MEIDCDYHATFDSKIRVNMVLVVIKHAAKLSTNNGHSKRVSFCFEKENEMISVKLVDGISLKSCKACETYATTSVDEMLSHLNEHNEAEIERLKTQKMVYRRVLKE